MPRGFPGNMDTDAYTETVDNNIILLHFFEYMTKICLSWGKHLPFNYYFNCLFVQK